MDWILLLDFMMRFSYLPGNASSAGAEQLAEKALYEGHGFSRVPMTRRLTQGDENQVVLLKGTAYLAAASIRPSITALQ